MIDDLIAGFKFPAVCKSVTTVTKSVEAQVQPVSDADDPNGGFVLMVSDFDPDEWLPLPAKIHFDTDAAGTQGLSVPNTAGSGAPVITADGDLLITGTFAETPHGQLVRRLVTEGHVWAASLLYFTHADGRRELLNATFEGVPDPDTPKGVVVTSKSIDNHSNNDGEDLKKAIHDLAVALGATCPRSNTKSKQKRAKAVDRGVSRAATMARAHARARKFALDQSIAAVMAEAAPSK